MRRVIKAALALSLLAGAIPGAVGAATPSNVELQYAAEFRESMGLKANDAYVRGSFSDDKGYSSDGWDVPLSTAEAKDLTERIQVQEATFPVIEYAAKQPGYGGAFFDQQDKGIPVFLFTKNVEAQRKAIGNRLPAGTRFAVREVEYTLDELTALKDSLTASRDALYEDGTTLVSSTVDVVNNRVEAGVLNRNERRKSTVKAIDTRIAVLDEKLPVTDACTITNCGKIKAGLHIREGNTVAGDCTAGFLARRWDKTPNDLVLVTAGHCLVKSTTTWKHAGTTFGNEIKQGGKLVHGWKDNSKADVGLVKVWRGDDGTNNPNWPVNKNNFLSAPWNGTKAPIKGRLSFAQQIVGTHVCRLGYGSHLQNPSNSYYKPRKCGLIHKFDTDTTNGTEDDFSCAPNSQGVRTCIRIKKSKKVDFDSWGGDSGGIVVTNNYHYKGSYSGSVSLLGTHTHSEEGEYGDPQEHADRGWYSTQDNAVARFDDKFGIKIWPCINSGCGF